MLESKKSEKLYRHNLKKHIVSQLGTDFYYIIKTATLADIITKS